MGKQKQQDKRLILSLAIQRSSSLQPWACSFTKPPWFFKPSKESDLKAAFLRLLGSGSQEPFLHHSHSNVTWHQRPHYVKQKMTPNDPSDREHLLVADKALLGIPSFPHTLRHGWSMILSDFWGCVQNEEHSLGVVGLLTTQQRVMLQAVHNAAYSRVNVGKMELTLTRSLN